MLELKLTTVFVLQTLCCVVVSKLNIDSICYTNQAFNCSQTWRLFDIGPVRPITPANFSVTWSSIFCWMIFQINRDWIDKKLNLNVIFFFFGKMFDTIIAVMIHSFIIYSILQFFFFRQWCRPYIYSILVLINISFISKSFFYVFVLESWAVNH